MSADLFHADAEKGIKRNGNVVYYFKDYEKDKYIYFYKKSALDNKFNQN